MSPHLNTVQDRIRAWRERKGVTVRELRDAVNAQLAPEDRLSLGTVSNYERPPGPGSRRAAPRADFLAALAEAFPELRMEWLLRGEGEPTAAEEGVARAVEAGEGGPGEVTLGGRVAAAFPDLGLLSPEASALFVGALTRYAVGEPAMNLSEEEVLELAADLRWLLLLPLALWGFEREPDYERFSSYCVAMLHALSLAMPEPGRGDPIAAHRSSANRRLREAVPAGFPGGGAAG